MTSNRNNSNNNSRRSQRGSSFSEIQGSISQGGSSSALRSSFGSERGSFVSATGNPYSHTGSEGASSLSQISSSTSQGGSVSGWISSLGSGSERGSFVSATGGTGNNPYSRMGSHGGASSVSQISNRSTQGRSSSVPRSSMTSSQGGSSSFQSLWSYEGGSSSASRSNQISRGSGSSFRSATSSRVAGSSSSEVPDSSVLSKLTSSVTNLIYGNDNKDAPAKEKHALPVNDAHRAKEEHVHAHVHPVREVRAIEQQHLHVHPVREVRAIEQHLHVHLVREVRAIEQHLHVHPVREARANEQHVHVHPVREARAHLPLANPPLYDPNLGWAFNPDNYALAPFNPLAQKHNLGRGAGAGKGKGKGKEGFWNNLGWGADNKGKDKAKETENDKFKKYRERYGYSIGFDKDHLKRPIGYENNYQLNKPNKNLVKHESHEHKLEWIKGRVPFKCDGCKIRGVGERYVCSTPSHSCQYNLHTNCFFAATTTLDFNTYECQYLATPPQSQDCAACGTAVEGFSYHCREMDLFFHPLCGKLKSEVFHNVLFTLQTYGYSNCLRCQKQQELLVEKRQKKISSIFTKKKFDTPEIKLQNDAMIEDYCKNVPGWSYVSSHNGHTIHVRCLMEMVTQYENDFRNNNIGASSALASAKLDVPVNSYGVTWLKVLENFLEVVMSKIVGTEPPIFVATLGASGVKRFINELV